MTLCELGVGVGGGVSKRRPRPLASSATVEAALASVGFPSRSIADVPVLSVSALQHVHIPYRPTEEHQADCIGSRNVNVKGPLNTYCPPQSKLFDQQVCNVPAFCGDDGYPFSSGDQVSGKAPGACACAKGEFLRGDVSCCLRYWGMGQGLFCSGGGCSG